MNLNDLAAQLSGQPAEEPAQTDESLPTGGEEVTDAVEEAENQDDSEVIESVEEDYEEQEETEQAQTWSIKADGHDRELTYDEVSEYASKGFDYTQKTMALAEQRKDIDAKSAQLDGLLTELKSQLEQQTEAIDWNDLRDNDPSEYLRQKELVETKQTAMAKAQEERTKALQEQRDAFVKSETQKLVDAMGKDWSKEKQAASMKSATDYLASRGVSEAEASQLIDHRLWLMIFDAAEGRHYQETKAKVKKEVKQAPKSVKPGQRVPPSERKLQEARANLKKANKFNSTEALADYLKLKG